VAFPRRFRYPRYSRFDPDPMSGLVMPLNIISTRQALRCSLASILIDVGVGRFSSSCVKT
jgi:hypothetical protein